MPGPMPPQMQQPMPPAPGGMDPMMAFMQMMQAGGRPGMPQGGAMPPMMPQGGPPQGMRPGMPPQGAPQGMPPGMQPGMPPQQPQGGFPPPTSTPQGPPSNMLIPPPQGAPQPGRGQINPAIKQAAAQGRGGDSLMAHLTPGEIAVPPEVQSPKVLATLQKAFHNAHVDPAQFTAGSPASSVNPATGAPEYNFMSSFLPIALGLAGSVLAPELLPMLAPEMLGGASAAALGAAGSGIGTAVGGLATGQSPLQAGLSGLGAGAGGYMLGGMGGAAGNAAGSAGSAAPGAAASSAASVGSNFSPADIQRMSSMFEGAPAAGAANAAGSAAGASPGSGIMNAFQNAFQHPNIPGMIGSGIGGAVGSALGAPTPKSTGPQLPASFTKPMTPVDQLGSPQQLLGQNSYKGPAANFNGYNPASNYPAAWNFFPQQQPGQQVATTGS